MESVPPFFSVVIDNHNYGRFLRQAVDSVLNQDFPCREVELIVVDDGSTDDSRDILGSYGKRLRAILQPRQGQATAFNRGLGEARGQIVCLLDSDDLWDPGKLSAVAACFNDREVGIVQHWLKDVDSLLNPLPQEPPLWPARYAIDDFLSARTRLTATSGLSFRRELLQKALPIPAELFYYLDDFLFVRTLFEAPAANINRFLGSHREHGRNWCAGGYRDARKLEVDFHMREIFDAHLKRWLSHFGRSLSVRYRELESYEVFRRRVLHAALTARPARAWELWREGFASLRNGSFGRFKLWTVLLAVLSPTLYLWAYGLYARSPGLKTWRLKLFPT